MMKRNKLFIALLLVITIGIISSTNAYAASYTTSITYIKAAGERIAVQWKYVKGVTGYAVYRRKSSSKKYSKIATVKGSKNVVYHDAKVSAGTKYYYKIRAYKGKKYYGYSKAKSVTMILTDPTIIDFTENTLKWTKIKGAAYYTVYYKEDNTWVKYKSKITKNYVTVSSDYLDKDFTVQAVKSSKVKSKYGDDHYQLPVAATDKKILIIGDSITRGSSILDPSYKDSTYTGSTIANRVRLALSTTVDSKNVSYMTYGINGKDSWRALPQVLSDYPTLCSGYDLIFVCTGTNDFKYGNVIGSIDDEDTFTGQVKKSLEMIRNQNSTAKIITVTPLLRLKTETNDYTKQSYDMKNSKGYSLNEYCDQIVAVSNTFEDVYSYDSRERNIINTSNRWEAIMDGIHLSQKYYAKVGDDWVRFIRENELL